MPIQWDAQPATDTTATPPVKTGGISWDTTPVKTPKDPTTPFKYDAPTDQSLETPEQKVARYKQEQIGYDAAAKKANSPLGFLGNTIKSAGETIASSEVALGKTIGKIASKGQLDVYTRNIKTLTDSQLQLQKLIKDHESKGIDATALKRAYNSNADLIDQNQKAIDDYNKELPTNGEAVGQIGGTALDLLTAGSYKGVSAEAKAALLARGGIDTAKTGEAAYKSGQLAKNSIPFLSKTGVAGATQAGATVAKVVAPEVSKVAEIASKPAGILTKKGIGNIAKGAGIGYASDVTQGMQGNRGEDRMGGESFIPGIGTVIGAGFPTVAESAQSFNNRFGRDGKINRIVSSRKNELGKLDNYASVDRVVQKAKDKGFDVKDFVAKSDLLHQSVDKTGTISTKGEGEAVQKVQDFVNKNGEDVVNKILEKEGKAIDPATLETKLKQSVMNSGLQGGNLTKALNEIGTDMAGYKMRVDKDGKIPLAVIHSAKVDKYSNINFMSDPSTQKTAKVIARTLKKVVEDGTTSADVEAINKELSKYYTVIDYLGKLDGKKVDGGKLGKYFARVVGATVGSHFGPLGTMIGAEAGGMVKGNSLKRVFGGKTGLDLKSSQMMKDAIAETKKPRLMLPAPKGASTIFRGNANKAVTENVIKLPGEKTQTTYEPQAQKINRQKGIGQLLLPAGPSGNTKVIPGKTILLPKESVSTQDSKMKFKAPTTTAKNLAFRKKGVGLILRSKIQKPPENSVINF